MLIHLFLKLTHQFIAVCVCLCAHKYVCMCAQWIRNGILTLSTMRSLKHTSPVLFCVLVCGGISEQTVGLQSGSHGISSSRVVLEI